MDESLSYIYPTKYILNDLDYHIKNKKPFSTIRFGDAIYGIIYSFFCPNFIDTGKWKGQKGKRLANSILGQLTVPTKHRNKICKRVITSANRANYIDSYDAYLLLGRRRLGEIGRNWKQIHEFSGIKNNQYCSCFLHYFSIINNEYNLFKIMNERKIFCIGNNLLCINKLKLESGAEVIDTYRIPPRGRHSKHYKDHYHNVMTFIKNNAKKYDLFLIGGGLLGKIYCDQVKKFGGRAFDSGRLFDIWSGNRKIDSSAKRFIQIDKKKMLCYRLRNHKSGVW